MATFPQLKTGAVMQYPAVKSVKYSNDVLRFLDGTEQRYRDCGSPLHQWQIRLDLLDETELSALEQFFVEEQGAFGSFAFTDPWDGTEYPDCSMDQDALELSLAGEMRGATTVVVRENRQ